MRTLAEVLAEAEHYISKYGKWGIATKDGLIDGTSHPTATHHRDLAKKTGHMMDHACYFVSNVDGEPVLHISTDANTIHHAVKHFNRMPHVKNGVVHHEHYSNYQWNQNKGKRYQVLPQMEKLAKEELDEAEHFLDYDKWGIVDDKHRIISGNQHPTAITHEELGYPKHKVEFAQDREGGFLSVRTRGKESLKIAAKTFASLPHMRSGMVTHTHFGPTGMDEQSGKSYEILARIKKMAGES